MAKTTRHGGASYEAIPINRPTLGGSTSVGHNSLKSSRRTSKSDSSPSPNLPPPVQETDSHLQESATALDSTANSADTSIPRKLPKRSGKPTRGRRQPPVPPPPTSGFDEDW